MNNGTPSSASFSGGSISGNRAYEGGGVYLAPGSFPTRTGDSATFTNETVSGNTVTEAGAGFFDDAGTVQPLTIASSTISGNHAGVLASSDGGGIEAFAPPTTCSAITLTNDTITANTAVNGGGYYGAGCVTSPTVATAFKFDTISGNTATSSAGAGNIQIIDGSALTLAESIVANGSASGGAHTNCLLAGSGTFTSGGYNLIDNTNCGTPVATDIIGKSPVLGALGNNGGPTQTEEPAAASPAVGAIPSAACSATGVSTDQRGDARGAGANGSCTIGSVEVASVNGYRFVASDGGIFDYGDTTFWGSTGSLHLNAPVVGMAVTPSTNGYWMVASDGGIFNYGDAKFFGSMGGRHLNKPIVGMAATADGGGYWLVAADGGIFTFGNAAFLGSAGSMRLNKPIVGMAATPDGHGYWLVASDGGIFSYGDAVFHGSTGSLVLNSPVVGMAVGPGGNGYWLVASDGGVFDYGSAGFFGSAGSIRLNRPVVGMAAGPGGNGYWLVASDGGIFSYGSASFFGSTGSIRLNQPIVGMSPA